MLAPPRGFQRKGSVDPCSFFHSEVPLGLLALPLAPARFQRPKTSH